MKKLFCAFLTLTFILAISSVVFADIRVTLDGELIEFDVPPQIINDRTMVPLAAIFTALNAQFDWDGPNQTVNATRDGINVAMQIGNPVITVDGRSITLDVAPVIVDSRTLVPARAVAESFNVDVYWDGDTQTVILLSPSDIITITAMQNPDNIWIEIDEVRFTTGEPLSRLISYHSVPETHIAQLDEYMSPNSEATITVSITDANNVSSTMAVSLINRSGEPVLRRNAQIRGFNINTPMFGEMPEVIFVNDIIIGETTIAEIYEMFGEPHHADDTGTLIFITYHPFPHRTLDLRDTHAARIQFSFHAETGVLRGVLTEFRGR